MEPSKQKLLAVELWGLGDLIIATPFLQAASQKFAVTLLAKPYAKDLRPRLWPDIEVVPFVAPWTAFRRKYRLYKWPWGRILRLRTLRKTRFDVALSARWDPRDHLLLWLSGAMRRLGFPRLQSQLFLNQPLIRPHPAAHRYDYWRVMGQALGLDLPSTSRITRVPSSHGHEVLLHSGAGQSVRVWPLDRYRVVLTRLRQQGYNVQIACDPDQRDWWNQAGEAGTAVPRSAAELLSLMDRAGVFIGNDSGPAHLAAFLGIPTFTIFGPQLPERFAPLHPAGEYLEGKPCPYKPCSDYCRFDVAYCITNWSQEEVWPRVAAFAQRVLGPGPARISGN
jgi:ADP-heptose:LPS heptosyltransferase